MIDRPTLAELRARAHKERHREIGNWLARRMARPLAIYGTWSAVRLGMSAHQVTTLAFLSGLGGTLAIAIGGRLGFIAGVGLMHLAFWLDRVDGQVARWRGQESLGGVYFDYLMHHAHALALGFALGYGLAARTGVLAWTIAGFAAGAGWLFLGLHNDCRYKAFFQRLKRTGRSYRIDGGSAERPTPPAPWPRLGRGLLTWPAYKMCEPHVVLLGLTAIAVLALLQERLWLTIWQIGLAMMALLAPTLAIGRIARAVVRDTPGVEFERWFQPVAPWPIECRPSRTFSREQRTELSSSSPWERVAAQRPGEGPGASRVS